jgi:hypothetical protein
VDKLTTTTHITQITLEDSVFVQPVNNNSEGRINKVENTKLNNKHKRHSNMGCCNVKRRHVDSLVASQFKTLQSHQTVA